MNVQVTIKIDRESITELAEVFRGALSAPLSIQPGTLGQAVRQAPQPAQPVPVAQPAPQGKQAYSSQIAQKTQLPPEAVTGGAASAPGLPTTAVPQEYTQDQIAVAFTGLIDTGRRDAVTQILGMFGAQALTQIPKEQYPELALKLREAGANI